MRCSDERQHAEGLEGTHVCKGSGLGEVNEARLEGPHSDEDSFRVKNVKKHFSLPWA